MKLSAILWMFTLVFAEQLRAQFDSLPQGDRIKRESGMQWLGCWTITMHDTIARQRRSVVVRLEKTRANSREAWQSYYGSRPDELSPDSMVQFSVLWGMPAEDSLDIWLIGLGGTGWRLGKSGDSLAGGAYETYDIIAAETPLGPAGARRRSCP